LFLFLTLFKAAENWDAICAIRSHVLDRRITFLSVFGIAAIERCVFGRELLEKKEASAHIWERKALPPVFVVRRRGHHTKVLYRAMRRT
jgi:hypothetical protein